MNRLFIDLKIFLCIFNVFFLLLILVLKIELKEIKKYRYVIFLKFEVFNLIFLIFINCREYRVEIIKLFLDLFNMVIKNEI